MDYEGLFDKISVYAKKAGVVTAKPVLTLYYVLKAPGTPRRDKVIIGAALAYLVLPVNLISAARFKLLGWADEAAAIALTGCLSGFVRIRTILRTFSADADKRQCSKAFPNPRLRIRFRL